MITGGCSGIGRAICQAFAESDASVICVDIDENRGAKLPEGIQFLRADTSREGDCQSVSDEALRQFSAIDILVNNAAIQPADSYCGVDELPLESWNRMIAVNLSGYTQMAKAVLPIMLRQKAGVIINMASGQGHRTARHVPAYGPIKAANIMQARQWGVEYARQGIRVASVSPGAIDTPLVRASLEAQGGEDALANRHPMGRIGRPEEVANAVLWLCSADAAFVTATDLEVDGGLGAFGAFADPYQ